MVVALGVIHKSDEKLNTYQVKFQIILLISKANNFMALKRIKATEVKHLVVNSALLCFHFVYMQGI